MKIQLPDFSKATVLIVGDVMLDRYWFGQTSRISPEAPVPVVKVQSSDERPGGAGNVALNAVSLMARVRLFSLVGEDEAGHSLEALLTGAHVETHFTRVKNHPTVTKLRILSRHQQMLRLDFEESFADVPRAPLCDAAIAALSGVGAVVLSDYGKGTLSECHRVIEAARAHGVPVFVDPKTADYSVYRGATCVTPNFTEFQQAAGICKDEVTIALRANELMRQHDLAAILVTRSEHGMTLFEKGRDPLHLPARAHEVFDVTGAGDTVIGVMAAAVAAGQSLREAMAIANLAAGIVVTKLGNAVTTIAELQHELHDTPSQEQGIVDEEQLCRLVAASKRAGEKIVMTNGCFDVLHPGHITYLRDAKALGARLIIAVNDDASVRGLKGGSRPINPLKDRLTMLAGLGSVDWVVPFSEDTPGRLIARVLPDVLVKGGDYVVKDIAGHEAVLANGGEVKIIPFLPGYSSSSLIERIKKDGK